MEEGSLRCDANVSVRPAGQQAFGTKAEVKNVNSFRYLQKALEYEIERQIDVCRGGGRVRPGNAAVGLRDRPHATRCAARKRRTTTATSPSRTCRRWSSTRRGSRAVRATMPELPEARRRRFVAAYGLPEYDAGVLTQSPALADYFEAGRRGGRQPEGRQQLGDGRAAADAERARRGHRRGRR